MQTTNTFYILFSGILLMFMLLGMMSFAAGLVRARNTTDLLLKNMILLPLACSLFLLFAYHMMFSESSGSIIPDLHFISAHYEYPRMLVGKNYSYQAGLFFQIVLSAISLSIVSGATAERLRLWPFVLFSLVTLAVIYPVQGYWIWGGGFLKQMGFIDMAGASVVHLTGALIALIGILFLGPRNGKFSQERGSLPLPGANIPLATLGAFLIWIGFLGFNASTVFENTANDLANNLSIICINTCAAASAGLISVLILSRIIFATTDLTLILNGLIVGLVSTSAYPLSGNIALVGAIACIAAVLMLIVMYLMDRFEIDDPTGAVATHGVGAICSLISVIFVSHPLQDQKLITEASMLHQLCTQLFGIGIIILWVGAMSLITWFLVEKILGLRIPPEDEYKGLDVIGCGMVAYPEFTASGWEK